MIAAVWLQLLDLGRENAGLNHQLIRICDEIRAVQELLTAPDTGKGKIMPRIIQLSPDGGGRYIAVDRDGELWRGEPKRSQTGGEEYIAWTPLRSEFPRDS